MKVKLDFVTNSSSTCFVLIKKGEFSLNSFKNAIGVNQKSIFEDVFSSLYNSLKSDLKPAREFVATCRWNKGEDFETFIRKLYSENTLNKILDAEQNGHEVSMGWLYDEHGPIEAFFCADAFIIDTDELFLDATVDGY
jgi:hypothetical protein